MYEQRAYFGGAWNYSTETSFGKTDIPQINPKQPLQSPIQVGHEEEPKFASPMYDQLQTNIPNNIMRHSGKSFPADSQLFPRRETVLQYLRDYAKSVKSCVKFQHQVLDIQRQSSEAADTLWLVRSQNLKTKKETADQYDAIVIASGHYTVPYIPDIDGIKRWSEAYPEIISHSMHYKNPETYRGKKVVVVGNSASGLDISTQISTTSKKPLLVSQRSKPDWSSGDVPHKQDVPEIVEFLPPEIHQRAVRFKSGHVETGIEAVLFCTGYLYSYPFLSRPLHSELIEDGFRVQHLYQHIFYIEDPTLVFLALPMKVIPFPLSEVQAAVVARVWSRRLELPSKVDMYKWENTLVATNGTGKGFHTLGFPRDFDYMNYLHDLAAQTAQNIGRMPPRWNAKEAWARERVPAIKHAFAEKGEERHRIRTMEQLGYDYEAWLGVRRERRTSEIQNGIHVLA